MNRLSENKLFKGKVRFTNKIYPKGILNNGDWGVMKADVVEVFTDSKIKLNKESIKIIGKFPTIDYNLDYKVYAKEEDNKYGIAYNIEYICLQADITTKENQLKFLNSILTESEFNLLYEEFEKPFDIIKNEDLESLRKVKGIGVKKALKIIEKYKDNIDNGDIFITLKELGLSEAMTKKLIKNYKSPNIILGLIRDNPYILAEEVDGIGFKKADEIALKNGIDRNSKHRIRSFIINFLRKQGERGHSFVSPNELMSAIKEYLGKNVDRNAISEVSKEMIKTGELWLDENKTAMALKYFYDLENDIFKELKRIRESKSYFKYTKADEKIKEMEIIQGWEFTDEQKQFIELGLKENLILLTGNSGVGKTSTVNALVSLLSKYETVGVALAGKAADRLGEITDCETMTIHKLLGYNEKDGFTINKENPIFYDIILVDETSMIGGKLFYDLIKSIRTGSKLILIGDDGQLEAIGECNIFADLLSSNIPKVKLTKIHRQAQQSAIITDSLKIRKGIQLCDGLSDIKETRGKLKDFIIDTHRDKIFTAPKVIDYFRQEIKNKNINDVQIIAPMRTRGDISVYELNKLAQDIYNPLKKNQKMIEVGKYEYKYQLREGDKVLIRKNNYKATKIDGSEYPVYNGNIGILLEIDELLGFFTIELKNKVKVLLPFSFGAHIELGYAITAHVSQGSQMDTVIFALDYSAYSLLTRELVYTAITRASKKCILCAESSALKYAINTSYVSKKQTFLKYFLEKLDKVA